MKFITEQDIYENLKKRTMTLINIKTSQLKRLRESFVRMDHEIKEGEIELLLLQSNLRLLENRLGQTDTIYSTETEECQEEE